MRRSYTRPVGEVINEYLTALRKAHKLREAKLINQWRVIVGPAIAQATTQLQIRDRVLYVQVNSAAVRHELFMARDALLKSLNNLVGGDVIDKIVIK